DFIDREVLAKQKAEGVERKLVAFKMTERGIPRHGYELADTEGNVIGVVTSGTMSPTLREGIGMGYVKTAHAAVGSPITVVIRGRLIKAEVVKAPFV
ncbi:MAG: glycine cleavage system aminomethyltransferase GcvT, partial [Rikenellaceae bacterium]|nr:glycine cleavage system aminomethyltransferase GcvT [Rikenellaceae bacterium]